MARRRYRRRRAARKNPGHMKMIKWLKNNYVPLLSGMVLGYVYRDRIGMSMIGETLDKIGGGADAAVAGLGAVFDPYGAVAINPVSMGAIGMGAVHSPYGAVSIGAAHSLAAEHAARNTLHNYAYPPPGMA